MGREKVRIPVSERALVQRINRKLADDDEILKKTRPARGEGVTQAQLNFGEFYVVDLRRNSIARKNLDLEDFGRELGVLSAWEELQES